jgi:hypothetical protein
MITVLNSSSFSQAARRVVVFAALICIVALLSGCGGQRRARAVDPQRARATLVDALDGWKAGKKAEELQSGSPSIVVQDPDWSAGRQLADYELLDDGNALDANLHCRVRLTFADADAKPTEKIATYVVGTDPVLTVFRDIFQ